MDKAADKAADLMVEDEVARISNTTQIPKEQEKISEILKVETGEKGKV